MRKSKLYSIGKYSYSKTDWETIMTTNPRKNLREQKVKMNLIQGRAQEILESLREFSFELFSSAWKGKTVISTNLGFEQCMKQRIEMFISEGRISSATNARTILNSFIEFCDNNNPDLRDLKPETFRQYQETLLAKGKSPATVGIYTREIRALYNNLINQTILESQYYPFGKAGFKPPSAKKLKTALMKEDIRKIVAYDADIVSKEAYCRDLWLFSYLCNGMNIKDIASLKYSNIKEDFIFFNRAKTKRTKIMAETISVPLLPLAKEIITRWGNPNRKLNNFIFPIFHEDCSPEDQRRLIQNASHLITDHIKRIAQKLDLPKKDITANTARDAFATVSMHEGRPISDISDSLGHSSISVTEHYLAGFANSTKMEWQKQLL
jgi:integrase